MTIGSLPIFESDQHSATVNDQFSRQASDFAAAPELHNDAVLALLVEAARPQSTDRMIDVACGPGTVVAALSPHVRHAVGLDATTAMLTEAKALGQAKGLQNAEWLIGNAYDLPYPAATFDIVVCRFAFHHLENPRAAFAEMARVASPGARIVLCDAVASDDPMKASVSAISIFDGPSAEVFEGQSPVYQANGLS